MPKVIWAPQPGPQTSMLSCPYFEVLYGGAAGGGKSDALLGDFAQGIEAYGSAWRGIIFRRTYTMLSELEARSLEIYGPVYGDRAYSIGNKQWKFPNGATLKFAYCDKDKDVLQYQGKSFSWVGWDELTQWPTDYAYNYLFSRVRSAQGAPCYIRATTNPGGPGHQWVKDRWQIPQTRPMQPIEDKFVDNNGELHTFQRTFIPAKVTDNKILMQNDPMYLYRLEQLSDPAMRSALKDGNWDVFSGMALPEWNRDIHVIPNAPVPKGVTCWRALDWGYIKPYACLWFYADYDGDVVVFNELYGQGDGINVGSQEPASVVREKIETFENEFDIWVPIGYLDPQCWAAHDDGPSIYTNLGGPKLNWQAWSKGPNSRRNQLQIVHDYLKVVNGRSRLRIMERCNNLIRTLPSLPLSMRDPEDIDTDAEDHAYDALRGGLVRKVMTRDERRRANQMRQAVNRRQRRAVGNYGGW